MAEESKIIISAVDSTKAAFNSVQTGLGKVEGAAVTLNGVIGRLMPFLGAATFTAFTKSGIDTLDMLGDLSDRTGIAASNLAGLRQVALLSDTSLESLGKGVNKLSVFLAQNGEAAKKLGITAKDPLEAYIQLADVISSIEDVQTRNALANKFLGKSYEELLPSLLQGGDALREQIKAGRELSGVTDENTKKAGEFNDKLDLLKAKAGNTSVEIASKLLPSLNEITDNFIENNKKAGLFVATLAAIGNTVKIAAVGTEQANLESRQLQLLTVISEREQALSKAESEGANAVIRKNMRMNIIGFRKELTEITAELEARYLKDNPKKNTSGNANEAATEVLDPASTSKSPIQTLQDQIALIQQENRLIAQGVPLEDAKTIARLKQQGIGDEGIVQLLNLQQETASLMELEKARANQKLQLIEDEKLFNEGDIRAIETEIELQNEQFDIEARMLQQQQLAVDAYDKVLEGIGQETEQLQFQLSLQGLSKEAQQEKIEARNVELALQKTLNELSEQGLGLSEEEIVALREKYTELQRLNTKVSETKNSGKELGLTFKSALEDAVVEAKDLGDVLNGLEQDIIRILTRRAITDPLTKGIDGILENFDFGSLFEFNANGGVYNSPSLSSYSGQVVSKPTMFAFASGAGIMGEAGAEGIFPLKRGKDGKLGVSAEGGGKANVVVNLIESPGNGGKVNQTQEGGNITIDVMVEKIESTIARNIGQGRGLAPVMERQYGLNRAAGSY